ncbi:MAG TPA: hypothetical protein RMH85_12760 [Polyangiaceae bacterium LLY-WYZ-15_(1-7)]|nr:hypothetical protein [Polyangiaceae bacterium LLY-WYZ-15_(1-7)]HJL00366.1 hypothetical protein [Polyangiaceae bacterium LLY-WYZ-15_(1-7)]HJL09369.1 hypothetical protein [Polyangiaceae bacterium LLY-WYZ-15_(1-7)]HJL37596.1 hypothetical protein [Polyangiaceae bacterium LLY-WYZ-15_(1-7)]
MSSRLGSRETPVEAGGRVRDDQARDEEARDEEARDEEARDEEEAGSEEKVPASLGKRVARRMAAMARVTGALTIIAFLVGYVAFQSLAKRMDVELMAFGDGLVQHQLAFDVPRTDPAGNAALGPDEEPEGPRALVLNGQRLEILTGTSDEDLDAVLAEAEARCDRFNGLGGQMPEEGDPSVRSQDGDRGYVACVDVGDEELSAGEWRERLTNLADTWDLSSVGNVHYVYGTRTPDGGTFFVTLKSAGVFALDELIPMGEGDVAGMDPEGVPRPPGGRRLLSAYEERQPYGVTMYGYTPDAPEEVATFYRDRMDPRVWEHVDYAAAAERRGMPMPEDTALFYRRRDDLARFVVIHLRRASDPELGTFTTVMEAR